MLEFAGLIDTEMTGNSPGETKRLSSLQLAPPFCENKILSEKEQAERERFNSSRKLDDEKTYKNIISIHN